MAAVGMAAGLAEAGTVYNFTQLTSNGGDAAVGAQLSVEVEAAGANQVDFIFRNSGPLASSITDVYFDDGTLLGIADVMNGGPGVSFSQGASPGELTGGNAIDFNTSAGFNADSNPPVQPMGVNPGEMVTIRFNLINGQGLADTIAALELALANPGVDMVGGLRIGIRIQGYANGASESFVNGGGPVIPLPSAAAMGAVGLLVVARRRRPC